LHGVQGVASSNPAAPTNRIKQKRPILGLAFFALVIGNLRLLFSIVMVSLGQMD